MKRKLSILVPLILLVGGAGWVLTSVRASLGYSVESEFASLPADDAPFERWLKAQPGVVPHTVQVERAGPERSVVRVFFIQSRNVLGRPAIPPLDQACRDLGYGTAVTGFRDSSRP